MRTLIISLFLLAAMPGLIAAQTDSAPPTSSVATSTTTPSQSNKEYRAHGYVFVAPGVIASPGGATGTLHFGGGGEGLVYKGLGVGAEIGGLAPYRAFDSGIGIFSVDASYHFLKASKSGKVVPFVNGGYTLFFRSGTASGVNFGGGVNYWFKERIGLRFEVRDHVAPEYSDVHYVGFRFGLAFR